MCRWPSGETVRRFARGMRRQGELEPSPPCADPSCAARGRRDRLPALDPGGRGAILPAHQCPPRTCVDRADIQQGLRGVGHGTQRRGHVGALDRPTCSASIRMVAEHTGASRATQAAVDAVCPQVHPVVVANVAPAPLPVLLVQHALEGSAISGEIARPGRSMPSTGRVASIRVAGQVG